MRQEIANPIVHLELHTGNPPQACAFYTGLFGWRAQAIHWGAGTYLALELAEGIEGGVVEHESERPVWIPYIEVADLGATVAAARRLGAAVTVEPREGPAGWRSVLTAPGCGELALGNRRHEQLWRRHRKAAWLVWPDGMSSNDEKDSA